MPANPQGQPRKSLRRWLLRLPRIAATVYLGFAVVVTVFQEHLIFPGAYMPIPAAFQRTPAGAQPFSLKLASGTEVSGLFLPGPGTPGERPPTILYFYGNGNTLSTSSRELELLHRCGANVLCIDYPGYGASTGKPSESNLYAAANALWDYALTRPEVDPGQILIVGWSLGGAVALDLAHQHPTARGLVLVSTFTTMDEMAHLTMPLLPTQLALRYHFLNINKIPDIECPIIIAHGRDDPMIPPSMSFRLRDAATGSPCVQHFLIPGAGHNDIFATGAPQICSALAGLVRAIHEASVPPTRPDSDHP